MYGEYNLLGFTVGVEWGVRNRTATPKDINEAALTFVNFLNMGKEPGYDVIRGFNNGAASIIKNIKENN